MHRALIPSLLLATLSTAAFAADALDKKQPAYAENAATIYRKTFTVLDQLKTDHHKWLQGYHSMPKETRRSVYPDSPGPPTEKSREHLLAMGKQLLEGIAAASKLKDCRWYGPDVDFFNTLGEHLAQSRKSMQVVNFRARHMFDNGKPKQAIDELIILMGLASHIGDDPTLFGYLIQKGIEREVLQLLGRYLPTLKKPQIVDLTARLKTGYRRRDLRLAMISDLEFVSPLFEEACLKEPDRTAKLFAGPVILGGEFEALRQAFLAVIDQARNDPEGFKRDHKSSARFREPIANLFTVPLDQFDKQAAELRRRIEESDGPVFKQFGTSLFIYKDLARGRHIHDARWEMWQAAVAYYTGGHLAFMKTKDPYGDGPFKRTENKGGFVLETKLRWKDFDPKLADELIRFHVGPVQPDQWAP